MAKKEPRESSLTPDQLETRFSTAFPRAENPDLHLLLGPTAKTALTLLAEGGMGKKGSKIGIVEEEGTVTVSYPPSRT
jgi:hypothetical protein